jgi:hypothetical protein
MHALLESMQKSQPAVIDLLDAPDLKDVLRAHPCTISLAFAPFEVHHGHDGSRFLLAGCLRSTAV